MNISFEDFFWKFVITCSEIMIICWSGKFCFDQIKSVFIKEPEEKKILESGELDWDCRIDEDGVIVYQAVQNEIHYRVLLREVPENKELEYIAEVQTTNMSRWFSTKALSRPLAKDFCQRFADDVSELTLEHNRIYFDK